MIGNTFFGDRKFKTPEQGYTLPQEGKPNGLVYASVYSFSTAPTATPQFTYQLFDAATPDQTILILGFEVQAYCYVVAGTYKALDVVHLTFTPGEKPAYPAGLGLGNTFNAGAFNGFTASGNPQNKNLTINLPGGFVVQPNVGLSLKLDFVQSAAFIITDTIVGSVKMYWSA